MKRVKRTSGIILVIATLLLQFSCTQNTDESVEKRVIPNTLKSVSLFQDSLGISSSQLYAAFEKVNNAIDSIGYPDAGYKLWEVISDDTLNFRFMVEGYWPDKETYELIHENELYRNAIEAADASWSNLKSTWYYRFNRVE